VSQDFTHQETGYLHATLRKEHLECACWVRSCGCTKAQKYCRVSYCYRGSHRKETYFLVPFYGMHI